MKGLRAGGAVAGAVLCLAGAARAAETPVPPPRLSAAETPLGRSVLSYYRAVAEGRPPAAETAAAEFERLLSDTFWDAPVAEVSWAGEADSATPLLSVVVADGTRHRAAFPMEGETVEADVFVYWDAVVPDFSAWIGRPHVGWSDRRGDRIFLNRSQVRAAAAEVVSAALASIGRFPPDGLDPEELRAGSHPARALADAAYALDLVRPDRSELSLEARIEHETLWHEAQHLLDRRRRPDLDAATLEYRGMVRGLAEGDLPYVNIGRLVLAAASSEESPYAEAAFALLHDLLREAEGVLAERPRGEKGVEDLLLLSAAEVRAAARTLLPGSVERLWYRNALRGAETRG